MAKLYAGVRLRNLREDHGMNQADLARVLGISPSYLNQIEHDSRPLTVPVLLRVTEVFGVDAAFFAKRDTSRLIAELREVFADERTGLANHAQDVAHVAEQFPHVAKTLVDLHRAHITDAERLTALTGGRDAALPVLQPHEQVRDFIYQRQNYFADLDDSAETLATDIGVRRGSVRQALADRLAADDIRVVVEAPGGRDHDVLHRYDESARVLRLSSHLRPGQQAFRMAIQLAFTEHAETLDRLTDVDELDSVQTRRLAKIGLANYFAAALVLPYGIFHRTAEEFRYDIERLADHFGLGYETICHRLSTLQRPNARGVPFSFVRVDRAGNVSKRQSATDFHFSRGGGTCPLWNVYDAFSAPGKVLTQIAAMPDGREYFWIARTVRRTTGRYGAPGKEFAIGLGCELRHAHRLVYATGLHLDDHDAAMPIGTGCKTCERMACPQRAFPRVGSDLAVDENSSTFIPYSAQAS